MSDSQSHPDPGATGAAASDPAPHPYVDLTRSADWRPGTCVTIVRPAVSGPFVLVSGGILGAIAALAVGWSTWHPAAAPAAHAAGAGLVAALVAAAVAVYLQGLHPCRELTIAWTDRRLTVGIRGRTHSYPLAGLQQLVLRSGPFIAQVDGAPAEPDERRRRRRLRSDPNHVQLDAEFSSGRVMLFDSDDHGRAGTGLPLERLKSFAGELAAALRVPVRSAGLRLESCGPAAIWRQSSLAARAALLGLLAVLAFQWVRASNLLLHRVGGFLLTTAAVAGPVALGIALGVRLVHQGRRRLADVVGGLLVVAGGAGFAVCASANKTDSWEGVPGGRMIGLTATYLSLVLILFGLGLALRHMRRRGHDP
jgi:hypothetical protein